mmetsp:Transcript_17513/g.30651  ORF Transcript_17513/g.30651 Transcript_17513/m.30651 type:complete len:293 (-) Transcript_17513:32-910(-)
MGRQQLRGQLWRARDSTALLLEVVSSNLCSFRPDDFSTVFHRLQQLSGRGGARKLCRDPRFSELCEALRDIKAEEWSTKDLALVCHALARLRVKEEAFFSHAARAMPSRLAECKPQDISNTMYAFALLSMRNDQLFYSVASHLAADDSRLGSFSPQAMSNTVYAFGQLGVRHRPMLEAFAAHLPARLSELNHQNISNVVHGLAILNFRSPAFMAAVSDHLCKNPSVLRAFSPQAMANTVFAFVVLRASPRPLFRAIGVQVRDQTVLRSFAMRDIAALTSSCVVMSIPPRGRT